MVPLFRFVLLAVWASTVATGFLACSAFDNKPLAGEASSRSKPVPDGVSKGDAACGEAGCARPTADAAPCTDGATATACSAQDAGCDGSPCGQVDSEAPRTDATLPVTDSGLPPIDAARTGAGGAAGAAAGAGGGGTGGVLSDGSSPLCSAVPLTAAGVAPTKDGVCTASDTQVCFKTCGPRSIGLKSETCTNGIYVEQSGCSFPATGDYSCYKIPSQIDPTCPATAPQAATTCAVSECVLCNVGNKYLDSKGNANTGFCICPAAASSSSNRNWSCAGTSSWPCPAGNGC